MTIAMETLLDNVRELHESPLWEEIKPDGTDHRASEYITQGRADLLRCVGNMERAKRVMGEE